MERTFASALVLLAHPDDGDFMCGGTVAAWVRAGTEVHYVIITDGSAGSNEPGKTRAEIAPVREREQRAAAEVLGVTSVTFLGEVDGTLEVNLDTRRKVCREVRRLRPEVIVAPDPSRLWYGHGYMNHWDHKQAGLLALTAVMPDAPTRPMFPELLDEGLEPFEVPNLWLATADADTFIDISARSTRRSRRSGPTYPRAPRTRNRGSGNEPKPLRRSRGRGMGTPRGSRPSASLTTRNGSPLDEAR